MKCEICKKVSKKVIECVECSSLFCTNCGNETRERCNICMQFEENSDQDNALND